MRSYLITTTITTHQSSPHSWLPSRIQTVLPKCTVTERNIIMITEIVMATVCFCKLFFAKHSGFRLEFSGGGGGGVEGLL